MLPETADALLGFLGQCEDQTTHAFSLAAMLRSVAPCLVLVARADGTIVFLDDFGSEMNQESIETLSHRLAAGLEYHDSAAIDVDGPSGPRMAMAVRLPEIAGSGMFVYVVEAAAVQTDPLDPPRMASLLAAVMTWAVSRHQSCEAESNARVEQLLAEQDTLRASYDQSLADAIEEHEQRLQDQELAQEELRQLHACNQMILNSAGEGIVGLDTRGVITFVNPAAERMVGWTPDEMVGQPLHTLVHHTRPNAQPYPWNGSPVQRTLQSGTTERVDNEVFWRKDGSYFPVEYVATPMVDAKKLVGAVVTFQNIAKRKLLESQLVQAQKLESIGQLAAGIAHEINTPTQFIGDNLRFLNDAFTELRPLLLRGGSVPVASAGLPSPLRLMDDPTAPPVDLDYLTEEIPKAISQSLDGVERVANIVRSMKEFSHPGGTEMEQVDLNRALETTLTVCRNEWKYVAEVTTDFDARLPLVNCLGDACKQVFLNLIINAAHAIGDRRKAGGDDKGTITVGTRVDGDWIEVRITDTGTGIPEQFRTRIFDPFFTTKEVGRGTGQGLAIARSVVVDKHGGTLSFETEVGRGTTFIVRLPRSGIPTHGE